jgi:quercetin dioxygenase-like cupin family protein
MRLLLASALLLLPACASAQAPLAIHQPPPGINEVLSGPIDGANGRTLVMGDLAMAPGAAIPRHRHAGEEFLYVIGGSAVISRVGEPDLVLGPGEAIRIAPGTVHWGRAGDEGMRAIASWVKLDGRPLREAVPE